MHIIIIDKKNEILTTTMKIKIIAAVSHNNVIGAQNKLPWNLPSDLEWFKNSTLNHRIIMGKSTYESIGRPLPNRANIVLSRKTKSIKGCQVFNDLELAINDNINDVFIIGGQQVYRDALPLAHELYITHVDANIKGDTFMPYINWNKWFCVFEKHHPKDMANQHSFTHKIYNLKN